MRTVVALGGNALCEDADPTVAAARERVAATADELAAVAARGHDLVLTHGNGPQVGQLLRQQETDGAPPRPLDVLGAETQGQLGYLVQQAVDDALDAGTATVVTRCRVDPDDPAFDDPSKPVGPTYTASEAAEKPFETTEVSTAGGETAYRRVVPSPEPQAVLERCQIRALVDAGTTVVCCGGGGVPVVDHGDDGGVEAVVDKDYATQVAATAVDADLLVMATDVDYAYTDFGTPEAEPIEAADPATMREHLDAGEFAAGSMRPKVEACLDFLDGGGRRAVVANIDDVAAAVAGESGTQIRP